MLYPRAMAAAFEDLPEPLQRFHSVEDNQLYAGEVTVSHGGPLARAISVAGGMPGHAGPMPFRLRATREGATEIWERHFGNHVARSVQWLHAQGVIAERFGRSTFYLTPRVREGRFHIPITGSRAFGLPTPAVVLRESGGVEWATDDGGVGFDVSLRVHGFGQVIRYAGVLRRV